MNKLFKNISPRTDNTSIEQFNDCFEQLWNYLNDNDFGCSNILKLSVFIIANSEREYIQYKKLLTRLINNYFDDEAPPFSILAQAPENGKFVLIEFMLIDDSEEVEIERYEHRDIVYLVLKGKFGKEIISSGISSPDSKSNLQAKSEFAFENIKDILAKEEMNFSNIIRQWNYIEKIIEVKYDGNCLSQNYQVFNDVRAIFYGIDSWPLGYPAATGIGVFYGGVIIDFIAADYEKGAQIASIKNPKQVDAHQYSEEVLIGGAISSCDKKAPPKFERGKLVRIGSGANILVSGTAAIIGQDTTVNNNVGDQTQTTIENIMELVSKSNINNNVHGINIDQMKFIQVRAYVKFAKDIPIVRELCQKEFHEAPIVFVEADICRGELLVEIEAIVDIKLK